MGGIHPCLRIDSWFFIELVYQREKKVPQYFRMRRAGHSPGVFTVPGAIVPE